MALLPTVFYYKEFVKIVSLLVHYSNLSASRRIFLLTQKKKLIPCNNLKFSNLYIFAT